MSAARALRWERRPDERMGELLDAALQVFARQGYRNTRLEDVAQVAGVTKGTIYHYFDTKEALLLAVVEHYQAVAFGRAEDVLRDKSAPVSTRIRLLVRKIFSVSTPHSRDLLALLIRGIAHEVPFVHAKWLMNGPVRLWTLLAALVEEGKSRGEFRPDADGDAAARLLVSGLMLQRMWQQHDQDVPALAIDEDRLIDSSVDLFLAAVRQSPTEPPRAPAAPRRRTAR